MTIEIVASTASTGITGGEYRGDLQDRHFSALAQVS
jgi:hypothetical protein